MSLPPGVHEALEQARSAYAAQNPRSFEAYQTATASLPGGGTRSSIFIHPFPLFIANGKGAEIEDLDGHVYQDFVSDFTSGIYGKTDPILKQAITKALDEGLQLGAHTPHEGRLASHLCSRFPSIELLRFTNSGTEANILAISAALHHTQRTKVVVFEKGYHGSVLSHFGEQAGDLKDYLVCPYNDGSGTRALVKQHEGDVGAIVVEPMLGAGGCTPGSPDFLQSLRDLANETGAVLIFDEVQTARLSTGGRQKILGITPDMTTLGKFHGGGFAFGAFGGNKEIMSMFDARSPHAISHGGTFNNSPLTMVAGCTAVEHLLTDDRLRSLNELGDGLRGRLKEAFERDDSPFKITGLGSINQLHPSLPGQPTKADLDATLDLLFFYLLEEGYWIAQRGLISLNFAMTEGDVRGFEAGVIACARRVKSAFAP
ncbi:hypothetical protein IAU60_005919 [Kwoniella sp. DSM 27419]